MKNKKLVGNILILLLGVFSIVFEFYLLKINDNVFLTGMGFLIGGVCIVYGIKQFVENKKQ